MGGIILDDLKNGALYIGTIPSSMDNNRCSVTLEDDGSVTFYIYAPNANKVEVAGMGGYFSSERIQLKPDMQGGFSANIKDFHWIHNCSNCSDDGYGNCGIFSINFGKYRFR